MAKCVITDARVHVAALFLMNCFIGEKPESGLGVRAHLDDRCTTAGWGGARAAVGQQCHFFYLSVCPSLLNSAI